MVQTEQVMIALILLAAVRARHELDTKMVFTWLLLGGLVTVLFASALYSVAMDRRPARDVT